ncbi:MAG: Phosphatidylinositol mannoside acyltransferase [Actinomycetota bacterium]|nr:Phosphatidylinositol mannoside acyltransferase [Actinomycetota bacterium]
MESPIEYVSYLGYTVGWRTVRLMPDRVAYVTFDRLADQLWLQRGSGIRQLERNLGRVLPDISQSEMRDLSRDAMRSYFRYWCDAFRLPDWSRERTLDTFRMGNREVLDDAIRAGTGAVVALPHAGNWDHAGAWGSLTWGTIVSVAEDLKPERLTRRFLDFRESIGMEILTLTDDGEVFGELVKKIGEGKIVALLGDRDLTASGVPVDFFGEPTRMPAGPAALARRTGAPLITATLYYDGPIAVADLSDPILVDSGEDQVAAVRTTTQRLADRIASGIAEHPVDWHMLQRLWLSDLDTSRLKASKYD